MDKELALAIDFKKAPKEVQDLANQHYANVKALTKAKGVVVKSNEALTIAQSAYDETAKALKIALKSWEPEV